MMYQIRRGRIEIDGRRFDLWRRDSISPSGIKVKAGTNGFQGGDAAHGSRTYFKLSFPKYSTDVDCELSEETIKGEQHIVLQVAAAGDWELEGLTKALEFIVRVLKEESRID